MAKACPFCLDVDCCCEDFNDNESLKDVKETHREEEVKVAENYSKQHADHVLHLGN